MQLSTPGDAHAAAKDFLKAIGVTPTASTLDQLGVFAEALRLFEDRNNGPSGYNDLWKQYGWEDNLVHMRSKLGRVRQRFDTDGGDNQDLDDAHDLLNYTTFFIRNVLAGNRNAED